MKLYSSDNIGRALARKKQEDFSDTHNFMNNISIITPGTKYVTALNKQG